MRTCTNCETRPAANRFGVPRCTECRKPRKQNGTEYMRAYRAANRDRIREHDRRAGAKARLARHNLTAEQYDALLAAQGGACALCGGDQEQTGRGRGWNIDHDHTLGCHPENGAHGGSCDNCRRGIICNRCNTALGLFGDDAELVARALAYLTPRDERAWPAVARALVAPTARSN